MSGWTAGSGLVVCYALSLFAIATGWVMIVLEERELERRFGDAYREYKRRTPALVPRIAPPGSAP
ncbi:MAG: methyltransferase family protein [Terriglobales bacterium]